MNTITKSGLPNEFTAGEVGNIYNGKFDIVIT